MSVLKATGTPGGSAARVSAAASGGGTYYLDAGPTMLTMPDLIADCFAALDESLPGWVTLRRLDLASRARFADGNALTATPWQ